MSPSLSVSHLSPCLSLYLSLSLSLFLSLFTEMCSSSEAGSYVRLIAFVYHSTLGLSVIDKIKEEVLGGALQKLIA